MGNVHTFLRLQQVWMRLMYWLAELQVSCRNITSSRKEMMESSCLTCFACRQRLQRQTRKPSHNSSFTLFPRDADGQESGSYMLATKMQREALVLIDWRQKIAESGWDFLQRIRGRRPSLAPLSFLYTCPTAMTHGGLKALTGY